LSWRIRYDPHCIAVRRRSCADKEIFRTWIINYSWNMGHGKNNNNNNFKLPLFRGISEDSRDLEWKNNHPHKKIGYYYDHDRVKPLPTDTSELRTRFLIQPNLTPSEERRTRRIQRTKCRRPRASGMWRSEFP